MKKLLLMLCFVGCLVTLSACEEGQHTDNDGKIQESIDKIKARIQESLGKGQKDDNKKQEKSEELMPTP